MPPLQPSSLDPMTVIPFSDQHASPFDKLFDSDLRTPPFDHHQEQQQQQQQQQPQTAPSKDILPSEADISALFGLAPAQAQAPGLAPAHFIHTSTAMPISVPHRTTASPSSPPLSAPSTLAPLAPVAAHYSSIQHNHLSQEKSLITPIPASPTFYNGSAPPTLTSYTPAASNTSQTAPTANIPAIKRLAHRRYPTYDTDSHDHTQQTYAAELPVQQYQQYENSALYQQFNSANNDYSQQGYSYTVDSTPCKNHTAVDPLMLSAPSRSIFSRFGGSAASSLSTESQNAFAPKLKVAASYVSSTLAVTSTFASEKLATASTKIADLWQQSQHSLPQQQPQQQPHFQQQQQDALYNHGHYYGTCTEASIAPVTINSDQFSNQPDMQQQLQAQYSYDGQWLNTNPTFNSNYQSSYNNNNNGSNNNSNNDNNNNNGYNNIALTGAGAYSTSDYSTRSPFASTATSTLSNAASVAGSYLPSLSKLPVLPALSTLPALRALPALPWVSRDKNQLPQQQPVSDHQYHQYPVDQKQHSEVFNGSYAPSQDAAYQQSQDQQRQQQQQHHQGYGYQYNAADWWGGIRNEVQKGRRMVETGVQVGVAWWWDSEKKNSLGGIV
ncbi:hypothetical protein BG015_006919 [Linnemannia schmuckeri]|uniref:Uncharacterized protein n=1 Tax=Linnemannia schmuckeri TaxID=64567 RepID=A0A9P5S6G9_9FUNG|nr:hypothetical protein BG015_006919 [Linnemannia schmuckeri]